MASGTLSQANQTAASSPENPSSPVTRDGKFVVFLFLLVFVLLGSIILGEVILKLFS